MIDISEQRTPTEPHMSAEARLEYLVHLAGARVVNFLARRIDPSCDAVDLYQQVLVTAWEKIDQVPDGDDEAMAWLFAVARNHLLNQRRKNDRRSAAMESLRAHITVRSQTSADVEPPVVTAMKHLTAKDREVLELIYWEELSTEQAAVVLKISATSCRSRLSRARKRLRDYLVWEA